MTDDQIALLDAEEIKQLLGNKHLKNAFTAVAEYLEQEAIACDPDHKERAQRIILCKQVLWKIKRELERKVEEGEVGRIRIEEAEKPRMRLFKR